MRISRGIGVLIAILLAANGWAKLRNVDVGDLMPEFSLRSIDDNRAVPLPEPNRVNIVLLLGANQEASENAARDVQTLITENHRKGAAVVAVGVINDPNAAGYFAQMKARRNLRFPLVMDPGYKLWGKLGAIVTPTILVVDRVGKIRWVHAGYSYDFLPALRAATAALDQDTQVKSDQAAVRTLDPDNAANRADRHFRMAEILAQKGQVAQATREMGKALELTPDSTPIQLEMGLLLCRTGQGPEAMALMDRVKSANQHEAAQVYLIQGWAQRQMGHLPEAEKLLQEALKRNPHLPRALYELGKIYQSQRKKDEALAMFDRALRNVFQEETTTITDDSQK